LEALVNAVETIEVPADNSDERFNTIEQSVEQISDSLEGFVTADRLDEFKTTLTEQMQTALTTTVTEAVGKLKIGIEQKMAEQINEIKLNLENSDKPVEER
jgi:hypothetical protein